MGDFDIEAYLEEQGNVKAKLEPQIKSTEDRHSQERERRADSRDRPRRSPERRRRHRSGSRSLSRDRGSRYRDTGRRDSYNHRRDRSGDRRDRSGDRRDRERGGVSGGDRRERSREKSPPKPTVDRETQAAMIRAREAELQIERELKRKQREIDDLTKDQRTVLVSQLTMKVNETDLRRFFAQIGRVNNIIMIRDKHTGRHKGIAYVEMGDLEDIPNCLLFNNVVPDFQKFAILVKPSEAEKNFVARKDPPGAKDGSKPGPDCRLYVGNIHTSITDDSLRQLMEQFGPTEAVTLHRDELGNSKGFAFVRFVSFESAQLAMKSLAGLELVGRPLKVGPVLDGFTQGGSSMQSTPFNNNMGSQSASANWKLDDDDGGSGMALNAQSRVQLMAKLGQAAGITQPAHIPLPPAPVPTIVAPVIPPITGTPSTNLVIRNMFCLEEETEPEWAADIREDVIEECGKHGEVLRCVVESRRTGGLVYLKFAAIEGAARAAASLHGRFFAGRMITASFLDVGQFSALMEG